MDVNVSIKEQDSVEKALSNIGNEIKPEVEMIVKRGNNIIVTDETYEEALLIGKDISGTKKEIEENRKEIVTPINNLVTKVNGFFKSFVSSLDETDRNVRNKIFHYKKIKDEERQKAEEERQRKIKEFQDTQRKLQEQKMASSEQFNKDKLQEIQEATEKVNEISREPESVSGVKSSFRKRWVYEIVDMRKVPREYMMVNDKVIKAAISSGIRDIPGLEIKQEESIMIR